ncbi:MAG: hypothetical protein ACLT98_17415 [Eggerthellaceae bacterium]
MNRKSAVLTLSIGIASAIVAVALALDLGGISSVLPIAAKGVWGFAGCAAALLVCGAFALAHKPTPQQIIEQGDERNAAINGKAGLCAFEAFSMLAPLAALALYASSRSARPAYDHRRRGRSLIAISRRSPACSGSCSAGSGSGLLSS